jgi:hypothetical protein
MNLTYSEAILHVRQAERDGQVTDHELETRLAALRRLYLLPTEPEDK